MKYKACHQSFLTVSDNRWSCGRATFQGNLTIKTSKTSNPFHNNIVLETIYRAHTPKNEVFRSQDLMLPAERTCSN